MSYSRSSYMQRTNYSSYKSHNEFTEKKILESDKNQNLQNDNETPLTVKNNTKCKDHSEEDIKVICFLNNCEYNSRLLCIKCMMGPHHEHYDHFTLIEEIIKNAESNPLQVKNWPKMEKSQDIKEFFSAVQQDIQDYNTFEGELDAFIASVNEILLKIKEKTLESMKARKEKGEECEQALKLAINKHFPLIEASTFLQEFLQNKFTEQVLNEKISVFINQEKQDQAEKEVEAVFEAQQQALAQVPQVQSHSSQVKDKMEQIKIVAQSLYSPNLKFQKCYNYDKDNDMETSVSIYEEFIHFQGAPMTSTYVFSDSFLPNEKVRLTFKINENDNRKHLFLGVCLYEQVREGQVFQSGNNFDIQNKVHNSKKESQTHGNWIENVLDRLIQVDICIKENLFKIQDAEGSCYVENLYNLLDSIPTQDEKDTKEWCIVFGTSYLHNFKIQILECLKIESQPI